VPFAIDRYTRELHRLYGVLDRQLADREYIAGAFSIADIATYPWIVPHAPHGQDLAEFPHLARWFAMMAERPGVRATYDGVECVYGSAKQPLSEEERGILFGKAAAATVAA